MLSVILPRTDEPTVIELTKENLIRELRSMPDIELIVADTWEKGLEMSTGTFVCFVEADCLVSSGYFTSNLNLFKKNPSFKKLAMVSSCVGLDNWGNRIYGYELEQVTYGKDSEIEIREWEIVPARTKKATSLFAIQVGYLPGAIIRRSAIKYALSKQPGLLKMKNPVALSTDFSFSMWGSNRRVHVNPNTTYVSTVESLSAPNSFKWQLNDNAMNAFERELI